MPQGAEPWCAIRPSAWPDTDGVAAVASLPVDRMGVSTEAPAVRRGSTNDADCCPPFGVLKRDLRAGHHSPLSGGGDGDAQAGSWTSVLCVRSPC
jgi:hypothetical protein